MSGAGFQCEFHSDREAVGYCCKCGVFLCDACKVTAKDPLVYCEPCYEKHVGPVPIPESSKLRDLQETAVGEAETQLKKAAYRVEVHFRNGQVFEGITYSIRPDKTGFFAVPFPPTEEADQRFIPFIDTKAVFLLKNPEETAQPEPTREFVPEGHEITVFFKNGEMLEGFALGEYSPDKARFHVIPRDQQNQTYVSVLVERAAVEQVKVGRVFRAKELRQLIQGPVRKLILCCYIDNVGVVAEVDDIAQAIGRTARIVNREIGVFINEGLMQEVETSPARKVKFLPPADQETLDFLQAHSDELHDFYARQQRLGM